MIDGRVQYVVVPMRDNHPLSQRLIDQLLDEDEVDTIFLYDNDTKAPGGLAWLKRVEGGVYGEKLVLRRWGGNGIIYRIWNEVWKEAIDLWDSGQGPLVDLTILNNDITVSVGMIGHLSRALRDGVLPPSFDDLPPPRKMKSEWSPTDDVWIVYPDYSLPATTELSVSNPPLLRPTSGTMRRGGMSGFCFMLKPEVHVTRDLPFIDEKFRWYSGDGDLVQQVQYLGATAARVEGLPLGWEKRTTSHNKRNKGWVSQMGANDLAYSKRKFAKGGSFPLWRSRWGAQAKAE